MAALSIHNDPYANGQRFGVVTVTIDPVAFDCMLHFDVNGRRLKKPRFHSLEEIRGAYAAQRGLAATSDIARDMAAALKFAGEQLKAVEGARG